jgi:alanine dehydrogenase
MAAQAPSPKAASGAKVYRARRGAQPAQIAIACAASCGILGAWEKEDHADRDGARDQAAGIPRRADAAAAREAVAHGHEVLVEAAPARARASRCRLRGAGARIADERRGGLRRGRADREGEGAAGGERARLREGQVLFTYLHLAPDPEQTRDLLASGATGDRLRDGDGCARRAAAAGADVRGGRAARAADRRLDAAEGEWRARRAAGRRAGGGPAMWWSSAAAWSAPGRAGGGGDGGECHRARPLAAAVLRYLDDVFMGGSDARAIPAPRRSRRWCRADSSSARC